MKRALVIGGHGKVALLAAPLLAEKGWSVAGAARNPDHAADIEAAGAQFVEADVERMSPEQLASLVADYDAVVWSAGAGGGSPERTNAVDREAAIQTIEAAMNRGVRRFLMVSYFGASQEHAVPEDNDFHTYAQAKADADDHLRSSPLDWTILGPSMLTEDEPSGKIDLRLDRKDSTLEGGRVSRGNVARVIAETLGDEDTHGLTLEFNDGSSPIAEHPWR